ncbi:Fe-S cluster assembly protein SufD [Candidatus Woesearchaeota archaeon]|nr:Fe-S cluster assembly protein SufD [Candidatus Woesearchaeota archaeon]
MRFKLKECKLEEEKQEEINQEIDKESVNSYSNVSSENVLNQEFIDHFSAANNEPTWLKTTRLESLRKATAMEMPAMRYGTSILLNAAELDLLEIQRRIRDTDFCCVSYKEQKNWNRLRKQGIVICAFTEACKRYQEIINNYFFQKYFLKDNNKKEDTKKETDEINDKYNKFFYLHHAYMNKTLFIYVPKNCQAKTHLEINSELIGDLFESIIVYVEENAKIAIIEQITSGISSDIRQMSSKKEILLKKDVNKNSNNYRSSIIEIVAQPDAEVTYFSLQSLAENDYNISYANAIVAEDATMNWFTVTLGSKFTKQVISTILNGKGSRANNLSFFLADKLQQFDLYSPVIHNEEHTHANIIAKGAVKDKSKVVYRGLIHIKENAHDSTGYQKEDNIILNEGAEADAIPILHIDNNDVKCSHGATIGQIDDEKMFYMQSRGIEQEQAKKIIVEGFFEAIIKNFPDAKSYKVIFDTVRIIMEKKLNGDKE